MTPSGQDSCRRALTEAQSDASRQPQSFPVAGSNDLLYVSNTGTNSITVYKHDQQGNTAPRYVITGSKTQISSPGQLSEDAQGNLYVANGGYGVPGSVLVFAHGANGNVAPIRNLSGPATYIAAMYGMTVDQVTGKLFVFTSVPNTAKTLILRFPPNANGNTAPFAFEGTALPSAASNEITADSTGVNLILASEGLIGSMAVGAGIYTTPKQFPSGSFSSIVHQALYALVFGGIVDDPTKKSYLFSGQYFSCAGPNNVVQHDGIVRFAESTNGSANYFQDLPCSFSLVPKPVSIITSDTCGGQLALGYLRNIYVVHTLGRCASDAIYVYTHDSSGNAPPLRILTGPATQLNQPDGIYEGT